MAQAFQPVETPGPLSQRLFAVQLRQPGKRGNQAEVQGKGAAGEEMSHFQGVGHGLSPGVVVEDDVYFRRLLQELPGPGRQIR